MTNAEKLNNMTNAELFYFMLTSDRCNCYTYNKAVDFCFNGCKQCKGELV